MAQSPSALGQSSTTGDGDLFERLPAELRVQIAEHLGLTDLLAVARASPAYRQTVHNNCANVLASSVCRDFGTFSPDALLACRAYEASQPETLEALRLQQIMLHGQAQHIEVAVSPGNEQSAEIAELSSFQTMSIALPSLTESTGSSSNFCLYEGGGDHGILCDFNSWFKD